MGDARNNMKPVQNPCPTCRKTGEWFAGGFGPFCSKRCRLVDLGKWFSEEHAISEPLKPADLDAYADLPDNAELDKPERT